MSYQPMDTAPKDRKIMLFGRDDVSGWIGWEARWEQWSKAGGIDHWTAHYHGRDEEKIEPEWWAEMPPEGEGGR